MAVPLHRGLDHVNVDPGDRSGGTRGDVGKRKGDRINGGQETRE
jgi:hypothetical protein